MRRLLPRICLALAFIAATPSTAQSPAPPGWTDLADLTLAAPVVLRAAVARVDRLSRRDAPDVPAGQVRAVVEADIVQALAAPAVLPARVRWLWQGAADARGRPPIAKGQPLLVFARPVDGRADQLQLAGPAAQLPDDPAAASAIRAVLADARANPDHARLRVTGVSDGFHAAGGVAGESESQFFLATTLATSGRPLTLVLLRRPGEPPALRVATGDLIDDSAAPVPPRTLLWRALACGLPPALPPRLAADAALVKDWQAARDSLGACGRTVP